ncbi:hypothetical protein SNEBB_007713 [Seison nebaliae]|nr:hypothetical protein SNEBB_007713 [Seison nebaliae]
METESQKILPPNQISVDDILSLIHKEELLNDHRDEKIFELFEKKDKLIEQLHEQLKFAEENQLVTIKEYELEKDKLKKEMVEMLEEEKQKSRKKYEMMCEDLQKEFNKKDMEVNELQERESRLKSACDRAINLSNLTMNKNRELELVNANMTSKYADIRSSLNELNDQKAELVRTVALLNVKSVKENKEKSNSITKVESSEKLKLADFTDSSIEPTAVKLHQFSFVDADPSHLNSWKKKKKYNYVIDDVNKLMEACQHYGSDIHNSQTESSLKKSSRKFIFMMNKINRSIMGYLNYSKTNVNVNAHDSHHKRSSSFSPNYDYDSYDYYNKSGERFVRKKSSSMIRKTGKNKTSTATSFLHNSTTSAVPTQTDMVPHKSRSTETDKEISPILMTNYSQTDALNDSGMKLISDELKHLKTHYQSLTNDINKLQQRNTSLELAAQSHSETASEKVKQLEKFRSKFLHSQTQSANFQRDLEIKELSIKNLMGKIEEVKMELKESKQRECQTKSKECNELKYLRRNMEILNDKLTASEDRTSLLNKQLIEKSRTMTNKACQIANLEKHLEDHRNKYDVDVCALEHELDHLHQSTHCLQRKVEELESKLRKSKETNGKYRQIIQQIVDCVTSELRRISKQSVCIQKKEALKQIDNPEEMAKMLNISLDNLADILRRDQKNKQKCSHNSGIRNIDVLTINQESPEADDIIKSIKNMFGRCDSC